MTAFAYYNEIDENAVAWLNELIKAKVIPDGVVDNRSILDVFPEDLKGFTQHHFFAGIGGWAYALRLAGWPDERRVWTGSCPCQPFSAAGKGRGFADERHLWPYWFHHITQLRPPTIFGEQVASQDGLSWLDLVQADMEATDYAFVPVDLCAAGVGSPNIRQRLWFVADSNESQLATRRTNTEGADGRESGGSPVASCDPRELAQSSGERREGIRLQLRAGQSRAAVIEIGRRSEAGGVADVSCDGRGEECANGGGRTEGDQSQGLTAGLESSGGAVNGFWADADWIYCRDDKYRPVEPGTFPLAHGVPARVGRLRGYGNAINPWVAKEVIEAFLDITK